jgi:uncharacterized YigZ family protein
MDSYNTIDQTAQAEFKDRGSKFIAHVFPMSTISMFKSTLKQLKVEHPKAVHHCFAYRLGLTGDEFRSSDDGEPAGTAGKPILGQIDSKQLKNVGIIVVRYFGGTLLGVPGLINAYKSAASMVLQVVPVLQKPVMARFSLQFDYTQMNDVMMLVRQMKGEVLKQETMLFCNLQIEIPIGKTEELRYRMNNLRNIQCSFLP